jgi:hypothetical protein
MTINAGDPPDPLPSELLTGTGVGAWLIRPADLDRLPYLTDAPPPEDERTAPGLAEDPTVDHPRGDPTDGYLPDRHRVTGLADYSVPIPAPVDLAARPPSAPLDPYRTPDGDTGPDAPLTLTYRELRRLIALHLAQLAATLPRDRPWLYAEQTAKAMSDGEMPLRLRDVLE